MALLGSNGNRRKGLFEGRLYGGVPLRTILYQSFDLCSLTLSSLLPGCHKVISFIMPFLSWLFCLIIGHGVMEPVDLDWTSQTMNQTFPPFSCFPRYLVTVIESWSKQPATFQWVHTCQAKADRGCGPVSLAVSIIGSFLINQGALD